jgi:hypothetical protein
MDWDKKQVAELRGLFLRKHTEMRGKHRTDRRNFSAIWNRYLENYGIKLLNDRTPSGLHVKNSLVAVNRLLVNLIDLVNYSNEDVSGALLLDNPDRPGQYLIVQRDIAERIMVLGML